MSERYSYDRRADTGPASRLKNVEPSLRTAEREIKRARSVLQGLLREMEMIARRTHAKDVQSNYEAVKDLAAQLDKVDAGMGSFHADLQKAVKAFR